MDTARAVEKDLLLAEPDGSGCIWTYRVAFIGLEGVAPEGTRNADGVLQAGYGHWYEAAVTVRSSTPHHQPSALERHVAFRAFANALPGAIHTIPNAVLGTDVIPWSRPA